MKLTTQERNKVLPIVHKLLKMTSASKRMYSYEIIDYINNNIELDKALTQQRLRAVIHNLRKNGNPIISGSLGYYMTNDEAEIVNMVQSLYSRAESIKEAADGLKKSIN